MYVLILADGSRMETSGAGESDGSLWLYGLRGSFLELVTVFGDPGKTGHIRIWYQDSLPEDIYEGYTELRAIMTDGEGQKVCLRKGA